MPDEHVPYFTSSKGLSSDEKLELIARYLKGRVDIAQDDSEARSYANAYYFVVNVIRETEYTMIEWDEHNA